MSYRVGSPIWVGTSLVVKGTSTLNDVAAWPGVLTGKYSGKLWRTALSMSRRRVPSSVVGHSLGATYARAIAAASGSKYVGYGRPGFGPMDSGDVANLGDPVSLFMRGAKRLEVGHALSAYA